MQTPKFLFIFLLILMPNLSFAQNERNADHEALRGLLSKSRDAINKKDFAMLKSLLTKNNISITTVDNVHSNSVDQFEQYWNNLYNPKGAAISQIELNPIADQRTTFLNETVGIVAGNSNETFTFQDGDVRKMETRWTATVTKEQDQWKISAIHFSANLLNNPVLAAVKETTNRYIVLIGGIGLVLGFIAGFFLRKRAR